MVLERIRSRFQETRGRPEWTHRSNRRLLIPVRMKGNEIATYCLTAVIGGFGAAVDTPQTGVMLALFILSFDNNRRIVALEESKNARARRLSVLRKRRR